MNGTAPPALPAALSPFDLRFERRLVRLRLTRPAHTRFIHGITLDGMLRRAGALAGVLSEDSQHRFPHEVIPYACESGRVRFEPGDSYHFLLTFVGEAIAIADDLARGIAAVGRTRPDRASPLPTLAGNFELEGFDRLREIDCTRDLAIASAHPGLTLRFLSPLRLELPDELAGEGHRYFDARAFPAPFFLMRLWQRLFFLANGRWPRAEMESMMPRLPGGIGAAAPRLLWMDVPKKGATDDKAETSGGVLGAVTLLGVPHEWLPIVALGQHVHLGKSTRYGLGRYVIDGGLLAADSALAPSRSLLARAASRPALAAALAHVLEHAEDIPEPLRETLEGDADDVLERLSDRLLHGTYTPPALHGFIGAKRGGGVRPLVVPPIEDRIAQRAAAMTLGESVDAILEDCSYAYRKGFSRAGAARAIARAYDEGYRYVLDADIASFFDAVDWDLLGAKLDALFPFEPLIGLVKQWVESPVVFDGRRIVRARGLPQGSPLAPLLANLFLDEFDENLLGRDYRLVRYADDFVVLCRNVDDALAAREEARASLTRLGLSYNEDKTAVRSIDDGFTYLGYLFCRSAIVDGADRASANDVDVGELKADQIPPFSWLAQVPFERIRDVARPGGKGARAVDAKAVASIRPLAPLAASGLPEARALYLLVPGMRVELHHERLVVVNGAETIEVPLSLVSHVVCNRAVHITVPLVIALSELGKPVFFCHRDGSIAATVTPEPPEWTLWMQQAELLRDEEACAAFAREIITAKLHNTATLAMRLHLEGREETAGLLRQLERETVNKTTLDALRGLEGKGAAAWFAALRQTLDEEWGFRGRKRTPPPDPVNAMLSLAYTILYHHASASLVAAGLNPRLGLFHHGRGAHDALASDLVEELRHLADAFVLGIIRHREIQPGDFLSTPEGRWPCLMADPARRMFVRRFEERMLDETTVEGGRTMSWRQAIDRQAWQVRVMATTPGSRYAAIRLHA
jgi:group II intron reverse transcriptase/maturase/CRISPR-associated endonuclease Cas1